MPTPHAREDDSRNHCRRPARCFAFQIHDYRGIRILYYFSIDRLYMCVAHAFIVVVVRRVGVVWRVARDSTGVPWWSYPAGRPLFAGFYIINDLFNTCKAAASLANYVRYACRNILCDRLPHDEQTVRLLYVLRVTLPCCFAVPNHRCQMTNPIFKNYIAHLRTLIWFCESCFF